MNTSVIPSKPATRDTDSIYDLKKSLNKIAIDKRENVQRKSIPVQDETKESKLLVILRDELKDANERLHSVQIQHENVVESNRSLKSMNEELGRDGKYLEAKLSENDDTIRKLRNEVDSLKLDKSKVDISEVHFKQEILQLQEEKKYLLTQSSKDKMTIQDLQRQCKEMEGILARRHPDSVSALIVASKHPTSEQNTKQLLEKRISFLENELREHEQKYQSALTAIHDKVNSMKCNYETHISDLENQVVSLQHMNAELKESTKPKNVNDISIQTDRVTSPAVIQTQVAKPSSAKSAKSQSAAVSLNSQAKDDSHLVATVRGLSTELSQKEKVILKLNRDLEESKKLVLKMQRDKDAISKMSPEKTNSKKIPTKSATARSIRSSAEALNSNLKSNKENEIKKGEQDSQSNSLKKDLSTLQKDYENLKKKRIEDLFALQTAHEKELMSLNVKVLPLQDDVSTLNTTVELLQNQIKLMDEQTSVILVERDHYKQRSEMFQTKLNSLTECESDRSTRSTARGSEKDYQKLKLKIAELEKRYEGRELRLKTLVDSVARLKDSQCYSPSLDSGHCTDRLAVPRQYHPF